MKNTLKRSACLMLAAMMLVAALTLPSVSHAVETKSGITTIDELNGLNVGVQTAVLYEELLLDRIPDTKWAYYTMPNDMIEALKKNKIDAYLIEEVGYFAQYAKHPELVVLDEYAGVCPFSIVVGANDGQAKHLEEMNNFIREHKANGVLDEMYDYWIKHFDADTSKVDVPELSGENGTIEVGIEGGYEPFSYVSDGKLSGFDVDFIYRFCKEYGYTPVFHEVPFESIAPAAETGKYDFGMNIAFSEERSGAAELTDWYYECNVVLVVEKAPGLVPKNGITTIDQLDGKTVGVQTAVLYEELLLDRLPNTKWAYYTMPNDMIEAVKKEKIDAYLIEEVGYFAQYAKHPELVVLDEYAGVCPFSIVVGANDTQAKHLKEMNDFIREYKANGTLDAMYDYWIKNFDADTSKVDVPELSGENGTIEVGIEGGYEPFSYVSDGKLSGFDVDFIYKFCKEYGYTPVFHEVPFESIAPAAETGKYDFGMNIAFSEERSGAAELTDWYYECNVVLVVEGEMESSVGFFEKQVKSFYNTFIKENRWKLFVEGTGVTVLITVSSVILGTLLGFAIYMACRHGNKVANSITGFMTGVIEGMPTVVFLMILYYIVFGATKLKGTFISIVGFTLIFGCSMYDMLCVGCNAIPKGQTEASRALGYSDNLCFFKIILPQAARHFLPIYKNDLVSLIKETSIVGYIAVLDLTKISDLVRSRTYEAFFALIATALIYFIIEGIAIFLVTKVEDALDPRKRSKDKILDGIKEWD